MCFARQSGILLILVWTVWLTSCKPSAHHEKIITLHPNGNPSEVWVFDEKGQILQKKTFHFNNIRASIMEMENGVPDGLYQSWGSNGDLNESTEFRAGQRHGLSETWYNSRQRQSRTHYVEGKLDGLRETFFPQGDVQIHEEWKLGVPVGTWTRQFEDGNIEERNSCHSDVERGAWEHFSAKGTLLAMDSCRFGILDGESLENFSDGKPKVRGQFRAGSREGLWIWLRADGTHWIERNFHDGLRDGFQRYLTEQGKCLTEALFQQGSGTMQIPCATPWQNVSCTESTWVAGQLEGRILNLDVTSHILSEENWSHGKIQETTHWKTDSLQHPKYKAVNGRWKDGKRDGSWLTWYSNGRIKDSLHYRNGELWGSQTYYDSTGHLYLAKQYKGVKGQVLITTLDPRPLRELSP